jgi:hemoglobin
VTDRRADYTVILPDALEFTPPSQGDQRRGVMRLSALLEQSRANIWRMPPASRGRRHRETVQEEIFVSLEGTATLLLGEPPTAVELPRGAIAIVRPGTPVQLANLGTSDATTLIVGAPPTVGDAEYLPSRQSLFDYAGGWEALHRLEQTFYDSVLADPLLAPLFGGGKPTHVEHLTMFTAESFGGPDRFTRELGFQHLIDVHRGLRITEAQRQRFVELYLDALDKAEMPTDPAFRHAVREHIEFGSQVAKQNSNAETDEQLHPLREVPGWTWPGETS